MNDSYRLRRIPKWISRRKCVSDIAPSIFVQMNMYSDLSIQLNSYPLTWVFAIQEKNRVTLLSLMDSGYKTYNDQCDSVMIPVAQKLRALNTIPGISYPGIS